MTSPCASTALPQVAAFKYGPAHDIKNLLVSDGSQNTSGVACNPTLAGVSPAIHQAENIAGMMQRKEIGAAGNPGPIPE
jgi:hypothetical protein